MSKHYFLRTTNEESGKALRKLLIDEAIGIECDFSHKSTTNILILAKDQSLLDRLANIKDVSIEPDFEVELIDNDDDDDENF